MTTITKDAAVTIAYKMTDPQTGKPLDAGTTAYLHGHDNLFDKVEAALEGQPVGHSVTIDLAPTEAFGERDESLMRTIPKSEFPPGVKVGGQLQGAGPDGRTVVYNVVKIKAPVLPPDTATCATPSLTWFNATRIEEFFLRRKATSIGSSMVTTSLAAMNSQRSCARSRA